MDERKPCEWAIAQTDILQAIRDGYITSTAIADAMGHHRVTIRKKLIEMYRNHTVIRHKIGQTFIYAVKED